jgi:hypothetical protein
MRSAAICQGSGALRVFLDAAPKMSKDTTFFAIDTCIDEAFSDAERNGYSVNKTDDEQIFRLQKEGTEICLVIAGGAGGGMDYKNGQKILEEGFKKGNLKKALSFVNTVDVALVFGFAGNATGTNLPLTLRELTKMSNQTLFMPCVGLPLRSQRTELDIAMNVTLKQMKRQFGPKKNPLKLLNPIIVDNGCHNETIDALKDMNLRLSEAFTKLLESVQYSELFRFDIGDVRRTLLDRDFAILGHTTLRDETNNPARYLMGDLLKLVNIEQQFNQPNGHGGGNKGKYGVLAIKTWHKRNNPHSKQMYDVVAEWASKRLEHFKTALWPVEGQGEFKSEVTVLMGGFPFKCISPII